MEPSPPPGARKGARRAVGRPRILDPRLLALAGATVVSGAAWAVLVYAGIRFGQSARGGDSAAWWFMSIAVLGAVACLFLALLLGAKVLRSLGVTARTPVRSVMAKGGRRAAGRRTRSKR